MLIFIGIMFSLSFFGVSYWILDGISGSGAESRNRFNERINSLSHISSHTVSIEKSHRFSNIKLLQRALRKQRFIRRLNYLIEITGWGITTSTFMLVTLLCAAIVFALLTQNHFDPVFSLVVSVISLYGFAFGVLKFKRAQYINKFTTNFPKALQIIRGCITAGLALNTSFERAAQDCPHPVNKEFQRLIEENKLGKSFTDTILTLRERIPTSDVKTFVVAVIIQQESGGNLAELMGNLEDTITTRVIMRKELKALTAQAKLSSLIISLLPVFIFFLIMGLNPDYAKVLIKTEMGKKLLSFVILLQMAGYAWIKKIVSIRIST